MSYDPKQCQSLFGYSLSVHTRCKWHCKLCEEGDMTPTQMRSLSVEHIIGRTQNGYLYQIIPAVTKAFPDYSKKEIKELSNKIDSLNTVSAHTFCNSITSRTQSAQDMSSIISEFAPKGPERLLKEVKKVCDDTLKRKTIDVKSKISVINEELKKFVMP